MTKDRIAALALVGVGVLAWIEAQRYGPLSRLFPQVVSIALVLLSLVMFASSFTARSRRAAERQAESREHERPDVRGVLLSLLVIVAWTLLLEVLGVWTSSVIAFVSLVVILRSTERAAVVWKSIALGVVLVTGFVLLFRVVLRVPLPEGVFW